MGISRKRVRIPHRLVESDDILLVDVVERKRGYAQANASHRPHRANETERKRRFALVQRASVLHARGRRFFRATHSTVSTKNESELQVFRLVFVARVSLPVRVRVRVRPRVESRGAEKKQAVSGELFRAEF